MSVRRLALFCILTLFFANTVWGGLADRVGGGKSSGNDAASEAAVNNLNNQPADPAKSTIETQTDDVMAKTLKDDQLAQANTKQPTNSRLQRSKSTNDLSNRQSSGTTASTQGTQTSRQPIKRPTSPPPPPPTAKKTNTGPGKKPTRPAPPPPSQKRTRRPSTASQTSQSSTSSRDSGISSASHTSHSSMASTGSQTSSSARASTAPSTPQEKTKRRYGLFGKKETAAQRAERKNAAWEKKGRKAKERQIRDQRKTQQKAQRFERKKLKRADQLDARKHSLERTKLRAQEKEAKTHLERQKWQNKTDRLALKEDRRRFQDAQSRHNANKRRSWRNPFSRKKKDETTPPSGNPSAAHASRPPIAQTQTVKNPDRHRQNGTETRALRTPPSAPPSYQRAQTTQATNVPTAPQSHARTDRHDDESFSEQVERGHASHISENAPPTTHAGSSDISWSGVAGAIGGIASTASAIKQSVDKSEKDTQRSRRDDAGEPDGGHNSDADEDT